MEGQRSLGLGEWIMNRAQIPVKEYEQLAKQFNPVKFNADEWVQLAQDAGMKYIVITSKHHDGFAMFKSKASPYNIVDATPFKRDVLKELADACAQARHAARLLLLAVAGLARAERRRQHLGLRPGSGTRRKNEDYDQYLRGKAEPQVRELLTGYGPVALIWFDTPRMMTAERGAALRRTSCASLQPNTLIDGRLGTEGDYRQHGRQRHPAEASGRGLGSAGDDQPHLGLPQATTPTGSRPGRSPSSSSTSSARAATTC